MRMKRKGLAEPKRSFRHAGKAPSRSRRGRAPRGAKRAVNLSIDADLLKVAREMKLNLSNVLEETLRKRTEDERIWKWRAQNKDVIESYNAYIERNGVLGEELLDLDEPPV